ncbi:MAG: nicotinate-nucleotide adenylyltransferase [Synergistaceae bacterium]|nr:nicotinate-nucleotide adenylyltransferase [Synergistaceae bacterium]
MGGTFDPIHYGHLLVAEECRRCLDIDRIVFIPTGTPPHKQDCPVTPAEDRYAMTLLATAGVAEYTVSRTEIDRDEPTHTVDTLREFIEGGVAPENLFFITGLDAILSITTWWECERLPSLCTLVTARRPGYDLKGIEGLPRPIRENLKVVQIPQFAISSTEIRQRVRDGQGIRFLVPHLVETYIESAGLYRDDGEGAPGMEVLRH